MCRKQNFEIFLGLKVTQWSWLYFSLSFLPSFFALLASFFSLAGHLVGFILVGKAFRILGLDERKGRWVVEQDFYGNFQVNVTWFFAFFSGVLDWIVLILVWFERCLHSSQVSGQSFPWPLKLMTSQAVADSFHWAVGKLCRKWFLLFLKKLSSLKMTRRLPLASQNYKVFSQCRCFNKNGNIKYRYQ